MGGAERHGRGEAAGAGWGGRGVGREPTVQGRGSPLGIRLRFAELWLPGNPAPVWSKSRGAKPELGFGKGCSQTRRLARRRESLTGQVALCRAGDPRNHRRW